MGNLLVCVLHRLLSSLASGKVFWLFASLTAIVVHAREEDPCLWVYFVANIVTQWKSFIWAVKRLSSLLANTKVFRSCVLMVVVTICQSLSAFVVSQLQSPHLRHNSVRSLVKKVCAIFFIVTCLFDVHFWDHQQTYEILRQFYDKSILYFLVSSVLWGFMANRRMQVFITCACLWIWDGMHPSETPVSFWEKKWPVWKLRVKEKRASGCFELEWQHYVH